MNRQYSRHAKNLASYFGASLIPMALNLAINPWIAKNMSPEDYAISGYYTSFTTLIGPVIVFYMVHYYIKEYFRRDENERTQLFATIAKALIWFSGTISIACFFLLLIYIKFIDSNFSLPISPYLALAIFAIPLTGLLNLQLARHRMAKDAKAYFRLSVSNGILLVVMNILFVVIIKWGAFGKLLAPLIGNSVVFLLLLWRFKGYLGIKSEASQYTTILKFCWPLALSAMLGYFTNGFTTTYLESVGDTSEYGIYVVGASIGAHLTVFSTAIGNTFQPDIYESTVKKLWKRLMKFCTLQIGLISLVTVAFILTAPYIISLLTAGRYIDSTPYAQIIALSTLTSGIYFLINNFSIATNHPKLYLYTSILGSIFIVSVMPWAVDNYSFIGGCWVSVFSFVAFGIINIILLALSRKVSFIN